MDCEVCYEKFDKNEHKPMTILPCTHTFCLKCLKRLKQQAYKCPKCTKMISKTLPCYALLNLLDLNLIVDTNAELRDALKRDATEIEHKKQFIQNEFDRILNETKNKLKIIKTKINNKATELINQIIKSQETLLNEISLITEDIEKDANLLLEGTSFKIETNDLDILNANELNDAKNELIEMKNAIDLKYKILIESNLNRIEFELKFNDSLTNLSQNLIGELINITPIKKEAKETKKVN